MGTGDMTMKEKRNLHLKVQEFCDCYATTDPLKGMSDIKDESDSAEGALKWLALAALQGINDGAEKISISIDKDGGIQVTAKYRGAQLPSPGKAVGEKIIETLREITHIEGEKGALPLALGIRDSSVDLGIHFKSENGHDKLTIKFPE
jgi:hypothetical protein